MTTHGKDQGCESMKIFSSAIFLPRIQKFVISNDDTNEFLEDWIDEDTNVTPIIRTHKILASHIRTHKNPLKPIEKSSILLWVRLPASNI
jgi:hypothetical protein